jgi:hypothetical protein
MMKLNCGNLKKWSVKINQQLRWLLIIGIPFHLSQWQLRKYLSRKTVSPPKKRGQISF